VILFILTAYHVYNFGGSTKLMAALRQHGKVGQHVGEYIGDGGMKEGREGA
jgi:hypothetical protein